MTFLPDHLGWGTDQASYFLALLHCEQAHIKAFLTMDLSPLPFPDLSFGTGRYLGACHWKASLSFTEQNPQCLTLLAENRTSIKSLTYFSIFPFLLLFWLLTVGIISKWWTHCGDEGKSTFYLAPGGGYTPAAIAPPKASTWVGRRDGHYPALMSHIQFAPHVTDLTPTLGFPPRLWLAFTELKLCWKFWILFVLLFTVLVWLWIHTIILFLDMAVQKWLALSYGCLLPPRQTALYLPCDHAHQTSH